MSFIGWALLLTCHGEYTNIPKLEAWKSPGPKHFHEELMLATSPWKFSWLLVKFLIMGLFLNLPSSDGFSHPVLQSTVATRSPCANTGAQSLALLPLHLHCLSWGSHIQFAHYLSRDESCWVPASLGRLTNLSTWKLSSMSNAHAKHNISLPCHNLSQSFCFQTMLLPQSQLRQPCLPLWWQLFRFYPWKPTPKTASPSLHCPSQLTLLCFQDFYQFVCEIVVNGTSACPIRLCWPPTPRPSSVWWLNTHD